MWQRSQTLFMALSAVLLIVSAFVSVGYYVVGEDIVCLKATGVSGNDSELSVSGSIVFLSGLILSFLLVVFAITQFKNRPFQAKLLFFAMVLQPILIGSSFFGLNQLGTLLTENGEVLSPNFGVGLILPFINLVLLFLARKAVLKDEELIRSVDRLR